MKSDVTENGIRDAALPMELVDVKVCAIDGVLVRTEVDDSHGEALSKLTQLASLSADSPWTPNLQYFAQRGDAFSILLHCADSDADPFREIVAFHCSDNYLPLKHGTENG